MFLENRQKQKLLKQINPELDITTKCQLEDLINMYCDSKDKEAFECALMTLKAEVTDRKFCQLFIMFENIKHRAIT
ncbi:hypothetical protein [Photobacterium leiognathi]|uniref:hypothetical protein n=1 Tax=Photobacterium leiognathi TaxID=553611 RepID=UPI00298144B8|nr:hypothetical protein [Photobacterium leiognathi]